MNGKELTGLIERVEKEMRRAAADLNFEQAAGLCGQMIRLKKALADDGIGERTEKGPKEASKKAGRGGSLPDI